MDPLSMTASIIAVLQLTGSVLGYLNQTAGANPSKARLAVEASSAYGLLTALRYRVEVSKANDPWFGQVRMLGVENGPIDQFKAALERLAPKIKEIHGLKKVVRTITWSFVRAEVQDTLSKIERLKTMIGLALASDTFALSEAIKASVDDTRDLVSGVTIGVAGLQTKQDQMEGVVSTVNSNVTDIVTGVSGLQQQQKEVERQALDELRQKILDWLCSLDFFATQNDVFGRWQQGTGQLFLDSPEFSDWLSGSSPTLLCTGIPGAGKTVLTSIAVNHLRKIHSGNDVGIAFLYCIYKQQAEQTPASLLSSLLKQLAIKQPIICDDLKSMYVGHRWGRTQPSIDEISQALHVAVTRFSNVYFVIDAVDECQEADGFRERLLSELGKFSGFVNIMFTARPHIDFKDSFPDAMSLDIKASDEDVRQYISGRIDRTARLKRLLKDKSEIQKSLADQIASSVNGMFLLAQLHMDALAHKATLNELRRAMNNLPQGLHSTYEVALQRIAAQDLDDRQRAMHVLKWVAYARRPLTVEELQHALAVRAARTFWDEDDIVDKSIILSGCIGLVVIDEESHAVRLIHETMQKFFEDSQTQQKWFSDAHKEIASNCLNYLLFSNIYKGSCPDDMSMRLRFKKYPLLRYAAQNWGHHARGDVQLSLDELILRFLLKEPSVEAAVQAMQIPDRPYADYSQDFEKGVSSLWLAAHFGLYLITKRLLDDLHINVDAKTNKGFTSLYEAASNGHEDVVKLLLDTKASTYIETKTGESALHIAARRGHIPAVRCLLERGASVKVKTNGGRTALHEAVSNQHLEVTRLLLQHGAGYPGYLEADEWSPLHAAVNCDDSTIVSILLASGYEPTIRGNQPEVNALHIAAENGSSSMVRLLLQSGAAVDGRDEKNETALHMASRTGHDAVVAFLLHSGADINASTGTGTTALHEAATHGHESVVRLLLDLRANTEAKYFRLDPKLFQRLQHSKGNSLQYRLAKELEVSKDAEGAVTALHRAVENKHLDIVKLLIQRGADIYAVTTANRTVLQIAEEDCSSDIAQVLLEAQAEVLRNHNSRLSGQPPITSTSLLIRIDTDDLPKRQLSADQLLAHDKSREIGRGVLRRLKLELRDIGTKPPLMLPHDDDVTRWKGCILGPKGSLYDGGVFFLNIEVPTDYPFKPPRVHFDTPIYHPNINANGGISLEILREQWYPALTVQKVLLDIQWLLEDFYVPPYSPFPAAIAYREDRARFKQTARDWVERFAKLGQSTEDLVGGSDNGKEEREEEELLDYQESIERALVKIDELRIRALVGDGT